MGNIGLGELLVIGVLVLLIFGPNKLPEIMRSLGKAMRTFQDESRKAASVLREGLEETKTAAAGVIDMPDDPAKPPTTTTSPTPTPPVQQAPQPPDVDVPREYEDT